jgi:HSP20 family protein
MEKDMRSLSDRFTRALSRWPSRGDSSESLSVADWTPSVDICETDGEFLVKAELPEIDKKDVKVTVEDGVLALRGERKQQKEEKNARFHRVERSYGSFLRTFQLPDGVNPEGVKAEFKDGMLLVHLPKTEKARAKTVDVTIQ